LALKEEKAKSLEFLEKIDLEVLNNGWYIEDMELSPFFSSVRNDARFQDLYQRMKVKWQKEHDLVAAWLEENKLMK
jgi:hypothetical protein